MVDYEKLYSILFNAITDAIGEMEENRFCKALEVLILAQQKNRGYVYHCRRRIIFI